MKAAINLPRFGRRGQWWVRLLRASFAVAFIAGSAIVAVACDASAGVAEPEQPKGAANDGTSAEPGVTSSPAPAVTVEHVAAERGAGDLPWTSEYLLTLLFRPGPRDLLWWQWIAFAFSAFVALAVGRIFRQFAQRIIGRVVARTSNTWDDTLLANLNGPLVAFGALATLALVSSLLGLAPRANEFVTQILRAALLVVVFWSMLRSIDVLQEGLARASWAVARPASRSLLSLGARSAKILMAGLAVVAALSFLGYPVASILAGLGIGGIALALAAQKTVENLFGAFSIGIDQPIREGDFVKVEDFVGTVETIGLRSTRIRTLDRTLITIPNGKLAEMRLESYTARDRIRLACNLGVVYATTAAQMREILAGLEKVLRDHPKIWPDAVVVRFKEFAESALNIEIMAWFTTADWSEFQLIRQNVLLQFMEVVEQAGSSFAFPTRTLHVERTQDPT